MKIQYFIFYILLILGGCNSQNSNVAPLIPDNTNVVQDNITSVYYFKGDVFGQRLVMQDSIEGIVNTTTAGYLLGVGKVKPDFINMDIRIGTGNKSATRRAISIYFPSIATESYSFDNVKNLFTVGKKSINQSKSIGTLPYENFTIVFETDDPVYTIFGNKAFTSVGNQSSDSYLEIVDVKDIKPTLGWDKGLQIKFRLSCKMYSINNNTYCGEIKNAEWVSKVFYSAYSF